MTHDEMIEVIAAHRDGKTIQYKAKKNADVEWNDSCRFPLWDFSFHDYRIKPEPLTLKECWWQAWGSSLITEHVLIEFIKLAKENGHA